MIPNASKKSKANCRKMKIKNSKIGTVVKLANALVISIDKLLGVK